MENTSGGKQMNMNRRVVITGMGAVSSLGFSADELWQAIKKENQVFVKLKTSPLTIYLPR